MAAQTVVLMAVSKADLKVVSKVARLVYLKVALLVDQTAM